MLAEPLPEALIVQLQSGLRLAPESWIVVSQFPAWVLRGPAPAYTVVHVAARIQTERCGCCSRLGQLYRRQAADRILATFRLPHPALDEFARTYGDGGVSIPNPRCGSPFGSVCWPHRLTWKTIPFRRRI